MSNQRLFALQFFFFLAGLITLSASLSAPAFGQDAGPHGNASAPRPLITQSIDEAQLTVLKGNTHPLARPQFDLGVAPATLSMQRMQLVLKRSSDQESGLRQLLDDQQDEQSPSYHKWLTPTQFGQQFGPTHTDIQTITGWLQSHGFQVGTTKGRTVLEFSGSASQVQEAFHTTIHKYLVNGEQHWANSSDPSIPASLAPAVAGVASLNNFSRKAMNVSAGRFSRDKNTGRIRPLTPLFTYQPSFQCSADGYCFAIGPYDFATIYNVLPLWNTNINGTGQTIAIVGESNINPQDVASFRSLFGLPANSTATGNPLNIILNGPDPGLQADESEADIDVQWSGAVAPYATIDFVVSQSTETTSGVDLSAVYVVENNLAPIMSESYGSCELGLGTTGNQFYNALWQQAAAQGITVFISAGDSEAAGCDDFNLAPPAPAQFGLAVSGYASTPYNVAVGGTDFSEFTNPTAYWNVTNNSTTQASALGYIPETTWNDSCTNANLAIFGFSTDAATNCNNSQLVGTVDTVGGSGGASSCTTPSGTEPQNCSGGYPKPSWQTGTGVPNDGKRDLPDVSLFASNGFAGSFYVICQSDQTFGSCDLNSQEFLGFGGTSVSSPAFAGIMALVNQKTGSRQGNANYVFYKLAAKQSDSTCNSTSSPASTCVFYDITSGTIAMPCALGSPNCNTSAGGLYGILTGYNTTTGYDLATGLGSVNANNLVNQWSSVTFLPSTTTLNSLTPTTVTHGQPVNFSVTVKPQSGTGTPSGQISLIGGPNGGNSPGVGGFTLSSGTAAGTTDLLPGGTYSVTAHYPGDGTYGASDSNPISITVGKENSGVQTFLVTFNSSGQIISSDTTTAVYGSPYILRSNVVNASGQTCSPLAGSGASACPTGTVTMTNNGSPLDAGTYSLNSYGYFEDYTVQLPGGTDSVNAVYAGDNSFNSSSAVSSITITPAPTSIYVPYIPPATVGNPVFLSSLVTTQSSGVAPTGTVMFSANGTPIIGTVQYSGSAGSLTGGASLGASLTYTPTAPGVYSILSSYGGDGNYAPSPSTGTSLSVQFPQPSISVQSSASSVSAGTNVTLTAIVSGSSPTIVPTGAISFGGYEGPLSGTVTYTTVTDPNSGNLDLEGTLVIAPSFSDIYSAQYTGDVNFPSVQTVGLVQSVTVTGSNFTLSTLPQMGSVTVTAGITAQLELLAGLQSGVTSVSFASNACSGLPSESTCSINPNPVTGTGGFNVFISTTAPHALALRENKTNRMTIWLAMLLPVVGILVTRTSSRRGLAIFLTFGLLLIAVGCGGGSSSGTGGGGGGSFDQGTPAGTYQIMVTGTSVSASQSATFTLIVQ